MTSYASQPTPDWPTSGSSESPSGEAQTPDDDREPASGGEWHTGPLPRWQIAAGHRRQDEAAGPQTGPAGAQAPAREQQADWLADQAPAREQQADWLADQAPAREQQADWRPDQAPAREQWARRLADQARGGAGISPPHVRRAVLSYLGVPFLGFVPALAVYLITPRTSELARRHAAQALNLSITVLLYNVCAVILGGLLALDTVTVAVLITIPLLAVLWILTLVYLVLAALAASRGADYRIGGWLCATLLR
jgi:uncharacterized Tic20 family protein